MHFRRKTEDYFFLTTERLFSLSFSIGQVVFLVQRQSEGQRGYDVLGVGKVSDSITSHSPDLIPVFVALMLNLIKQLNYSLLVKLVLWPRTLVAVYGKRITEAPPPVEPPSPVSAIPTSSKENRRMNYVLQVM